MAARLRSAEKKAKYKQSKVPLAIDSAMRREARYYALGRTDQDRLLFVAFTVRRSLIRVISAREMTRRERGFYETYDEQEGPEVPSGL